MKKVLLALTILTLAGCGEYSDGERVGTIQKFSRKGLINKTWEGEMLLGGLRRQTQATGSDSQGNSTFATSMVANVFEFTVEDPALIEKVKALLHRGGPVRAYYRQEYITHPWRTHTGVFGPYFLTRVEAAD